MIHSTSSSTTTTSQIPAFTTSTTATTSTSTTSATSSTSTSVMSILYVDNLLINKLECLYRTILPLYKRLSSYLLPSSSSSSSSSNNNKNTLSKATKIAILYQICSIGIKIILMIIEIIHNNYDNRYRHEMIISSNRLIGCMKMIVDGINESMSMLKSIINLKKYNAFDNVDELIKMFSEDSRLQLCSYTSSISSLSSSLPSSSVSSSSISSSYNQLLHRSWYLIASALAGLRECRRLDNFDFKSVNRISTVICCLKRQGLVQYNHHQQLSASIFQPEWLNELMSQVSIHEISYTTSLEEMSKLFPRRLPQIVALWCVETPVTHWDKVSIGMSRCLSTSLSSPSAL
jgi:hypothetical protein